MGQGREGLGWERLAVPSWLICSFPYNSQVPRGKGGLAIILNQEWQDSLLLLWGLKCLLTTLLCRISWPSDHQLLWRGSLPNDIQKSNVTCWLRANSRKLWWTLASPLPLYPECHAFYFSGPLFSCQMLLVNPRTLSRKCKVGAVAMDEVWSLLKTLTMDFNSRFSNSTSGCTSPKWKIESQKDILHTHKLMQHYSADKSWKQPKCSSMKNDKDSCGLCICSGVLFSL